MNTKNLVKRAFTLVELIIVIAIIAILAVTAFLLLTKWLSKARDSSRASDLATIETALTLSLTENTKVPMPENYATITAGTDVIGYQGIFGELSKDSVGNINSAPKDPNDKEYYVYYIDKSLKNFQLLGFVENETAYNPSYVNATDYSKRYFTTKGSNLGILVDSNQTPINQTLTGLDVMTGNTVYTAIFDKTNKLSGTGQTLQWLRSNMNNGGPGFGAPKECPTGFIPVPGNKDFNQPGFCVAKYEMKQKVGTAGNRVTGDNVGHRNTGSSEICGSFTKCLSGTIDASINLDGKIESKPEGMPIVILNQATAIRACQQMGSGYHLLTNREYMTIARNIEQQGENRNSGIVGTGGVYRGKNKRYSPAFTANKDVTNLDCQGGQDWNGADNYSSLVSLGTSTACQLPNGRNKRSLKLSSNEWIWDFVGNVREYVNKADTIDGINYNSNNVYISNICGSNAWFSFYSNDSFPECIRVNSYSYNLIGPLTANLNANNGMGRVLSWNTSNNILLRGGGGSDNSTTGLFTFYTNRGAENLGSNVGFRCAK